MQRERERHPRLRLFVSQSLSTITKKDWTLWFRDQILEHGLLQHRPVLQFGLAEVVTERHLAAELFAELRRLGVKLCLKCEAWDAVDEDLIGELPISLVGLPSGIGNPGGAVASKDSVRRYRERGWAVIATGIDSPKALARVWQCGVELVQGGFLQMPSPELEFDFSEVVLT
jgi:EAL domain-containing protein (putative c-di-GMP-specific phosphodiesterase class I)